MKVLLPGATIGIIGGGQLGRYFVLAARRLGYSVVVLDPSADAPAMQVANQKIVAPYGDAQALEQLATVCEAITIEFENVPFEGLSALSETVSVAPSPECVRIAQDRRIEKVVALQHGLTPAPNATVESSDDISAAIAVTGIPAILKTATLGYDGKGQVVCESEADVRTAFEELLHVPCVLEQRIDLDVEVSVVLCRSHDAQITCFPIAENVHVNGILDISTAPASISKKMADEVIQQAQKLAHGIDYVGVLGVEFFIATNGTVYFNEMAPRPHNSGHYTLDATATCQFEQQVRMLCALPAGDACQHSPVSMVNILGDSWGVGAEGKIQENAVVPNWSAVLQEPSAHLHLYGKAEARTGRKMGHVNCLASDTSSSLVLAEAVRNALSSASG